MARARVDRRMLRPGGVPALVVLLALGAPLAGQEPDGGTHALKGALVGSVAGGALGGLGLGVLAEGLCESSCDNAFLDGFILGAAGGAAVGGITGLIIGAAIPRDGAPSAEEEGVPAGPWTVRIAGGVHRTGPGDVDGSGVWIGVGAARPTSPRVRWGVEWAALGHFPDHRMIQIQGPGGETVLERRMSYRLWQFSLVAARRMGGDPWTGPYLLASAGVYPLTESSEVTQTGPLPDDWGFLPTTGERRTEPYPGVGIGTGGSWRLSDRVGVGVEGRLHLVIGAGDGPGLPVANFGGALLLGF